MYGCERFVKAISPLQGYDRMYSTNLIGWLEADRLIVIWSCLLVHAFPALVAEPVGKVGAQPPRRPVHRCQHPTWFPSQIQYNRVVSRLLELA